MLLFKHLAQARETGSGRWAISLRRVCLAQARICVCQRLCFGASRSGAYFYFWAKRYLAQVRVPRLSEISREVSPYCWTRRLDEAH